MNKETILGMLQRNKRDFENQKEQYRCMLCVDGCRPIEISFCAEQFEVCEKCEKYIADNEIEKKHFSVCRVFKNGTRGHIGIYEAVTMDSAIREMLTENWSHFDESEDTFMAELAFKNKCEKCGEVIICCFESDHIVHVDCANPSKGSECWY